MPFIEDLQLRHRPGHNRWEVISPLRYLTQDGEEIVVPAFYLTDLASIPRPVWRLVPRDHPTARRPATLHDYLYTHQTNRFSKAQADRLFYQALREEGMNRVLAWLMWKAVGLFGRGDW